MTYKKIISCWIQVAVLGCILVGNLHAGVTEGGVTAYRLESAVTFVLFTTDPGHDPFSAFAPLGGGAYGLGACSTAIGGAGIVGRVCNGTAGDTVDSFVCDSTQVTQTDSLWCLFSENPRSDNKAWAVKYSAGEIPTNDGQSIVRCLGADTFDPATGCTPPLVLPTQISVEGGYIKLEVTNGTPPPPQDCDFSKNFSHWGRMSIDRVNSILYICTDAGWVAK